MVARWWTGSLITWSGWRTCRYSPGRARESCANGCRRAHPSRGSRSRRCSASSTSPACTELETHVLDWLADLLDLPAAFRSTGAGGGVLQDTASSATLVALLAARERATAGAGNTTGLAATARLTVYSSSQAHSSVEKAVRIAGVGSANLRLIDVDDDLAIRPESLAALLTADVAAGAVPVMVVATVG